MGLICDLAQANPSRTNESCTGGLWSADFFGASPVASALGIRPGATPRGQSIAVTASRNGSYSGRWYWPLARAIQPCWQASLMAS